MFSNVVVGVKEPEAGRDALCLARALTSAKGNLTLAHVQVVAPKAAPDSGAAGAAARRRDALDRLTALEYGDPVQQLGRFGRSVDLLVLGSHSHGSTGLLGTGIAQRLADAPPCPLLVVQQTHSARGLALMQKSYLTRSSVLM